MVDWISVVASMLIGAGGGLIWWLVPDRPTEPIKVAKRIIAGALIGFIWNTVYKVNPITGDEFDSGGVLQLFTVGYMGLAALGTLPMFGKHFNESAEKKPDKNKPNE